MPDKIRELYSELRRQQSLDEYRATIEEYAQALAEKGSGEIAARIRELANVRENRFSKRSAKEDLEFSKKRVLDYLSGLSRTDFCFSDGQAAALVGEILGNFHNYCRCLYKEPIHGKCGNSLKTHLPGIIVENEYDMQRLLYPIFCVVFGETRMEKVEDSGHHAVRKDIVLDRQDIAIELKCTRQSMTERQLSEEVASDIVHYENHHIFFYIYDKENVIKNASAFKRTYEEKKIDNKSIHVYILQSNVI